MTTVIMHMDERCLTAALQDASRKLDSTESETVLDFSSVGRIDASGLRAIEELARVAEEKAVKVVLRGVKVDVYKTLKLMKLTRRFSFVS